VQSLSNLPYPTSEDQLRITDAPLQSMVYLKATATKAGQLNTQETQQGQSSDIQMISKIMGKQAKMCTSILTSSNIELEF